MKSKRKSEKVSLILDTSYLLGNTEVLVEWFDKDHVWFRQNEEVSSMSKKEFLNKVNLINK